MEIVRLLPNDRALVRQGEVTLEADVSLIEEPEVGEFTIVHAGFALEKIAVDEAAEQIDRWETLQDGREDPSGFG
jgi:hydrogenase expression/formation protein HypC